MFLIVGLITLSAVLVLLTSRSSKTNTPDAVHPASVHKDIPANTKPAAMEESARLKSDIKHNPAAKGGATSASKTKTVARDASATGIKPPHEQAVAEWESLTNQVILQKNVPASTQAQSVKEAFDKLDKDDQMDGIRHGLNLLPDDRFAVLDAILYDKGEDPEVLDAIFSDALNRPEAIKMPILKTLRKDREHPMFFEAARILDVVEPPKEAPQK